LGPNSPFDPPSGQALAASSLFVLTLVIGRLVNRLAIPSTVSRGYFDGDFDPQDTSANFPFKAVEEPPHVQIS
jgi:hypothetical protein